MEMNLGGNDFVEISEILTKPGENTDITSLTKSCNSENKTNFLNFIKRKSYSTFILNVVD